MRRDGSRHRKYRLVFQTFDCELKEIAWWLASKLSWAKDLVIILSET